MIPYLTSTKISKKLFKGGGDCDREAEGFRNLSASKKLFIVAGSIFGKKKLGDNKIGVPSHCYKIVINPTTKKIIHCLVFPNNKSNTFQVVTFTELKQRLGYRLVPAPFWAAVSQKN